MQSESDKKIASAGEVFRAYWAYARKQRTSLFFSLLGALMLQAALLAGPLYLRQFFNLLAAGHPGPETVHQLVTILFFVVGIWFFDWLAHRVRDHAIRYFETTTMKQLSTSAFQYLLGHSYNFFISTFAGSLTHRVNKYSRSFEIIADSILLQFFPTLLFVSGAIGILFIRNHMLGLALLVWTVFFLAFQIWVSRLRQPARAAAAEADTKITATLADAISNQSTIMLFAGTIFEQLSFTKIVEVWHKATSRLWEVDEWIWAGIGLLMIIIEAGLLFGATYYWGQGLLTIGDFVLIQAYLLTTFERLISINRDLRRFYSAITEAGEMVAILQTPHEIKDVPDAKALSVSRGEIAFNTVSFAFNNRRVLNEVSLTIHSGEKIALVGPSGAGKSTITKLLLRFYDLQKGSIEIDGQNIAHVTQDSLRESIAFVPQEPILFHRTLMENIRYGRRDASDAEVLEAAKQAHCHEFISQLPLQYETFVGERGIKLSGGERQRVAIARAILKNAPILVLDEATSSLDSESEALIQDALEVLMRGKTVMVIAHRLSTIMKMDRIVVMQDGSVVAEGTHNELIKEEGLYHKLWSIQAGGFILDTEEGEDEVSKDDLSEEFSEPLAEEPEKE